jgi:hypothetical protein
LERRILSSKKNTLFVYSLTLGDLPIKMNRKFAKEVSLLENNSMESCEGCVYLDTSLFPKWWEGDCKAGGTTHNGIPIIDRVRNARAEWGHCGPKRMEYATKKAA